MLGSIRNRLRAAEEASSEINSFHGGVSRHLALAPPLFLPLLDDFALKIDSLIFQFPEEVNVVEFSAAMSCGSQ